MNVLPRPAWTVHIQQHVHKRIQRLELGQAKATRIGVAADLPLKPGLLRAQQCVLSMRSYECALRGQCTSATRGVRQDSTLRRLQCFKILRDASSVHCHALLRIADVQTLLASTSKVGSAVAARHPRDCLWESGKMSACSFCINGPC